MSDDDKAKFAETEAKLQEMMSHHSALEVAKEIAEEGARKLLEVAEPLGEMALRALVTSVVQSLAAKVEARLGGG